MNLSLKKEPIKKISSDTFAIDFSQARQYDVELFQDNSRPITSSSVAVSTDGTLYLNTKHKDYKSMKEVYEIFSDVSTENLIKIYKMYDSKCPDVHELEDVDKYIGKARGNAMTKMLLKIELLRRDYKSAKVQPLLNLLLHGECD